jgi:hypothetical protein
MRMNSANKFGHSAWLAAQFQPLDTIPQMRYDLSKLRLKTLLRLLPEEAVAFASACRMKR